MISTCKYAPYKLVNYYYYYYDHFSDRLKELFQLKNGLTTSLLVFFFWKMPKIWVGRTTLNGEKKGMA